MSMFACQECGRQVSTKAATCPCCGANVAASGGGFGAFLLAALIVGAISVFTFSGPSEADKAAAAREAAIPPERRAAEAAEKARAERRFQNAAGVANVLKLSMRNPKSFELMSAQSDELGRVVCLGYRAQNGFGGYSIEMAVFVNGVLQSQTGSVGRFCMAGMYPIKALKYAID